MNGQKQQGRYRLDTVSTVSTTFRGKPRKVRYSFESTKVFAMLRNQLEHENRAVFTKILPLRAEATKTFFNFFTYTAELSLFRAEAKKQSKLVKNAKLVVFKYQGLWSGNFVFTHT